MFLAMAMAAMLVIVVVLLRFTVLAEGSRAADVYKMLAIVILALVAVCIYQLIRS